MLRRFVAFIDILGFKAIVERNRGNIESVGRFLQNIYQSSIVSAITGESVLIGTKHDMSNLSEDIQLYQFSDSLIMYTKDDSNYCLEKIIWTLNLLMARSVLEGIPLRGGLVKGEMFAEPPILVGDAINRAYLLESKQEWSGIIVDSGCIFLDEHEKVLIQSKVITRAPVPVKDREQGIRFENHLVINWPEFLGQRAINEEEFKQIFWKYTGTPEGDKEIKKMEHTLAFYKEHLGSSPIPSFIHQGVVLMNGRLGVKAVRRD